MTAAAAHAACDAGAAHSAQHVGTGPRPNLTLVATILASSLAFVDGSVVNVGLPTIGRTLAADPAALQWVVNAYLLPLSALLLLGGAFGDRFGRRRLLMAGTALFATASLGCAAAPDLPMLFAGRLLQGVGAAMLMPNSLAILGSTFSGPAKGRAIGIWAASGAAMGALGPVLGGWLIDVASWRAIFLINLPLAAGAIWLAIVAAPPDRNTAGRAIDGPGGLLAAAGLGALTWALTAGSGPRGWSLWPIAAGCSGLLMLVVFVLVERQRGDRAMMPLALFASRSFVGLTLLTVLLYGALGGLFVLLPYVLIEAARYSAAEAGAALLPLPLVLSLTSPLMGGLAGRIGPRLPLGVGSLVVAAGMLLMLRIGSGAAYWVEVLPALLVVAFGLSGAVAPLTTAVLNAVDAEHTGSASGLNSAAARTGGLIATALLGSVLAARGNALISALHGAAVVATAICVAASASALALVRDDATPPTS